MTIAVCSGCTRTKSRAIIKAAVKPKQASFTSKVLTSGFNFKAVFTNKEADFD